MIEDIERYLHSTEHLRKNIPVLIEAFVKYYGEDRRQEIEDKFSRCIFLTYQAPEHRKLFIFQIADQISNEIIEKKMKKTKCLLQKDLLFENHSFMYHSIQPISHYKKFYEQFLLGREGREKQYIEKTYQDLCNFLPELKREEFEEMVRTQTIPKKYDSIRSWLREDIKSRINLDNVEKYYQYTFERVESLLHTIDENITADNFGYYLDREEIVSLNTMLEEYPSMLEEYNKRMAKYQTIIEEDKKTEEYKHYLLNEYYLRFLEENKDLIPESEREGFEKYRKDPRKSYELGSYTQYLFAQSITSTHPLDAFSIKSCEILEDPNASSWKKDAIKKERIEFFKRNGIDLGNNYEDYLENPEVKKIWPAKERVKRFLESRNRLVNEFNIEFYTNTPQHKEARRELESKKLLDKDDSFNATMYSRMGVSFVNPNIVEGKKGKELYPLVVICCDSNTEHVDHDIVHELNHLFELYLNDCDDTRYETICGWDVLEGTINQEKRQEEDTLKEEPEKRKYELFSELINELIAQEICELLLEKHQVIFDVEGHRKITHTTSYENGRVLVLDFFKEYKKEILESRQNGNIQVIWDKVGKEKFDALNDLFHEYFEHFQGFKYYHLLQSLQDKEDTPATRKFYELIEKRNEILKKMRMHSMLTEEQKTPSKKESKKQ